MGLTFFFLQDSILEMHWILQKISLYDIKSNFSGGNFIAMKNTYSYCYNGENIYGDLI